MQHYVWHRFPTMFRQELKHRQIWLSDYFGGGGPRWDQVLFFLLSFYVDSLGFYPLDFSNPLSCFILFANRERRMWKFAHSHKYLPSQPRLRD
jgi:hypothetical protein